jgi:hypothetical protein
MNDAGATPKGHNKDKQYYNNVQQKEEKSEKCITDARTGKRPAGCWQ